MFEGYRDLVAWQKAMAIAETVYQITRRFPDTEKFGLTMQLRRAAVSVPSTLAEGHARASTKEFARYVSIAMGSLAEIETQLLLSTKLGFLETDTAESLLVDCDEQGRILRGLKKSLDAKIASRTKNASKSPASSLHSK